MMYKPGAEPELVPAELRARLLDPHDYRGRAQAARELRAALGTAAVSAVPPAALLALLDLLHALLDDANFEVALSALEATRLLAQRLGRRAEAFAAPLAAAAAKALGDPKAAVRRERGRLLRAVLEAAGPRRVLPALLPLLRHRSARAREDVLGACMAALLAAPAQLDLPRLARALAPALADGKRRVRHAALEAFALLAWRMGPGGARALLAAVDAVELQEGGAGVVHAVQARLARRALPRLAEHGLVEYAVPLPSCAAPALPRAADTEWLLRGSRARSAHSHCGCEPRAAPEYLAGSEELSSNFDFPGADTVPRDKHKWRPLGHWTQSPGAWLQQLALDSKAKFSPPSDFLQPPKLRPSQGMPVGDELFFSRKRPPRNLFQNSIDVNSEHSSVCAGALGSPQPHISGKCGQLGYTQFYGKSGSVDSDLQFLGLSNGQQEKGTWYISVLGYLNRCASLNLPGKAQRMFCSPADPLCSQGSSAAPATLALPSYPLSSPRGSPKRAAAPAEAPARPQDRARSFSSSWPLQSFEGLPKPRAPQQPLGRKAGDGAGEEPQETPPALQLKPTLVRHPAARRGLPGSRPVPPIPRGGCALPRRAHAGGSPEERGDVGLPAVGANLAAQLAALSVDDGEVDPEELQSSLRSLRNSAAKKRAKLSSSISDLESPDPALRLDLSADARSRASSPSASSCSESGLCSQEALPAPLPAAPPRRRVMSDTFPLLGNKSHPPRISSARSRDTSVTEHTSSTGTSNVSIVGQRLRCGNGCGDFEDKKQSEASPTIFKSQNTEHQRNFKYSKGFTGSTSSFQQMSSLDFISPRLLPEDSVAVVGKGVFGSSSAPTCSQSVVQVENGADLAVKPDPGPSPGVYGRGIWQSGAAHLHVENEKGIKIAMSKSAQDKMRQKKKEQNHKEQHKDLEVKEENPWAKFKLNEPQKMTIENFYGDISASSGGESSSLENVILSPSLKRTSSLKKTQCSALLDADEVSLGARGQYKERTPSVTHSPEIMDPSELQPFSKPETALTEALRLLADDDWEKKIEGLNFVRCLSAYHADILTVKLHETSLAVAQEVKNLRSGVSRAAVVCLGDLFTYLKKNMDQELDNTVKVLLHKAGESNTFIREDVDKALKAMVNNVTPARALCSLINGGQSHLHTAVRRCTAQHLADVVERMGPARVLCGTKDVTDRILAAVARFAQDGSQETRYYGRKMLFSIMTHPDFDKMLEKYVPAKDLPYIKESVSNLRQKGLGEMPLDTPSAKGRRSHTGSVGHSRSSSTSRDALNLNERESVEAREVQRKTVPHNSLETAEYVKVITDLLNAKDFRDRINGIKQLLSDTENNQDLVVANIVKIFDAFKSRLHDSNSKVNQVALETMHKMIPLLKDNLSPVINMLIPAMVDNNLNSKNPGIYAAVTNVIQALCQHLDNYLLLQPFCTKAQFLNGKAKQDMTEKLADLVTELYPRRPHAVEQKVLVVLWHLLGSAANSGSLCGAGGNIRTATAKLSKALFAQMGPSLLAHAASQPPHIKRSLEEVLDIGT
ncbi:TOG array regulator of axonemal microtubules protein 1 [Eudromia elegans]